MAPVSFLSQISFFICFLTFGCGFRTKHSTKLGLYLSNHGDLRLDMRTLLIDNFDSYTYNIWQLLSEVNGEEPIVVYNNAFNYNWDELLLNVPKFDNIVISPGPGSPDVHSDFGICREAILQSNIPVLGVCLGHQGIAHSFGATVRRAKIPMHGRLSSISHTNAGLFHNIPQESSVVRYHSLVVDKDTLPRELRATAWTSDNVIMGLEHTSKPIYGVQFHPESISTACGKQLFSNFKVLTEKFYSDQEVSAIEAHVGLTRSGTGSVSHGKISDAHTSASQVRNIVISKRTFSSPINVKSIFRELYGESSASFWLDSSSSGPVQGRADRSTPISIFGDLDSSEDSFAVEYHGSNQLTKRKTGQKVGESLNCNIFEFLDQELENGKKSTDVIYFNENSGNENENKSPAFSRKDPAVVLPFNITSALFGFLGYEARHEATEILTQSYKNAYEKYDLSATHASGFQSSKWVQNLTHPMAFFMRPAQYVVHDHASSSIYVVSTAGDRNNDISGAEHSSVQLMDRIADIVSKTVTAPPSDSKDSQTSSFTGAEDGVSGNAKNVLYAVKSKDEYRQDIEKCLEYIKAGESYEICLTLQFKGECEKVDGERVKPLDMYENLRAKNPAPYSCYLHFDPVKFTAPTTVPPLEASEKDSVSIAVSSVDPTLSWCLPGGFTICSSSPERYLKASKDGIIESKPIKGTARRNLENPVIDAAIAQELRDDEKSQAENLMVVDLVRNDFGRVCDVGSVCVPDLMRIETYASVHQLVSTIKGKLQKERSLVDAIVATFPGGSMTGAPKLRTMDIIDEIESRPRGIYSGAIGYIGYNGESDLNIVIRTAILAGDTVTVGSGGAIVALSEPSQEVDEVILKAQAVSRPLGYTLSFGADVA